MGRTETIRFAAGSAGAPYSGVWRLFSHGDDVYIGASKASLKMFKFSLHKSGVWVLAGIEDTGVSFEDGNRRVKQWTRPPSNVSGITIGMSVVVPHTSLGSRRLLPDEGDKDIMWYAAPAAGMCADFTVYFADPSHPVSWNVGDTVLGELLLKSGSRVFLIARSREMPTAFVVRVEDVLRTNVVRYNDPKNHIGGCLLLISESADEWKTPLVVDLPVPVRQVNRGRWADGANT